MDSNMWSRENKNDSFGGGAGGFVKPASSFAGDFGSPSGSQGTSSKARRSENVVPVTVAFILRSFQNDDKMKIGNTDVAVVRIVGLVRSINHAASNSTYEIDDLSGKPISVKHWMDGSSSENRFQPVENTYVSVTGNVRNFQGKITITALKLKPLTSVNELTTHLLEVMHSKLILEKGFQAVDVGNISMTSHMSSAAGYVPGVGTGSESSANPHGLNPQQLMVYNAVKSDKTEAGCSTNMICTQLNMTRDQIKKIIEFMSGEGHIYTTIDEDHFKTTD